jgi:hypothetical protein
LAQHPAASAQHAKDPGSPRVRERGLPESQTSSLTV